MFTPVLLHDERRGADVRVPETGARLGRDPDCEIAFPEDDNVVSAFHARIEHRDDGTWWIEDLGSTNGTWLDGARVAAPTRLATGQRLTLGQRGPALRVRIPGEIAPTRPEMVPGAPVPALRLRRVAGGEDLTAQGRHIIIGRAAGSTIALRTVADTVVSKHHAVVDIEEDGSAAVSDLGSKNGTYLNGQPISGRTILKPGDRLMFGWTGPLFEVRALAGREMAEGEGAPYQPERQPPKTLEGMVISAGEAARDKTGVRPGVFLRTMARQMVRESSVALRVATLVVLVGLLGAVGLAWRSLSRQTAAAEVRLQTAERELIAQRASADSARRRSDTLITRLRDELTAARQSAVSRAVLDSMEGRLRDAEARAHAAGTGAGGSDFARVARENQRAVGLVIVRFGAGDSVMGSGFAITRSGFFVTNRHVVRPEDRIAAPRTVEVVQADDNVPQAAEVLVVSSADDQDIAILRIRTFRGQAVRAVDWFGRGAQQGAPAAMLGFPLGTQLALDERGFVRTTMFAGIIAQVGPEWLRFGGTTFNGASGSPVFNAAGEVIAVHFGVLRDGPGLGFSVPMSRVRRWLPPEARAELGL